MYSPFVPSSFASFHRSQTAVKWTTRIFINLAPQHHQYQHDARHHHTAALETINEENIEAREWQRDKINEAQNLSHNHDVAGLNRTQPDPAMIS